MTPDVRILKPSELSVNLPTDGTIEKNIAIGCEVHQTGPLISDGWQTMFEMEKELAKWLSELRKAILNADKKGGTWHLYVLGFAIQCKTLSTPPNPWAAFDPSTNDAPSSPEND